MISGGNKKILVTGASGLLGGNILFNFPKNWFLTGLVNHHSLEPKDNIEIVSADLMEDIDGFIKKQGNFDVILHTAALTSVEQCEEKKDLAYKMHVEVTGKLAEWAKNIGAHFVHISTDHIFDGKDGNYSEESPAKPVNYYAQSKLDAEKIIQEIGGQCTIVRTNFFGFNLQDKQDIAGWMIDSLKQNKKINLFNDVFFSPILVNRLVDLLAQIIEQQSFGIINVVSVDGCSKYDFGIKLADAFGLDKSLINPISIDESNLKVARPKNMTLNTTKAQELFSGKVPTVDECITEYKKLFDNQYNIKIKTLLKI